MNDTTFVREKKNKDFSVMDNTFLRDDTLSMSAKGLFAYFLFLPDDWVVYQSELCKHFSNGKDAIRSATKELEEHGYLVKEKKRDEKNRFAGYTYTIHEEPVTSEKEQEKETAKQENSADGFPAADFPLTEFPKTDSPTLGNPPLPNTDNTPNTDKPIALKSFTNVQDFKAAGSESDADGCPSVNVNFSEKTVSPCNENPQSKKHKDTPSFNKGNLTSQASPQSQAESMSNSVSDTIPPDEAGGGFPFADDDKPRRKATAKRKSKRTTPDDTELDAYFATVDSETVRRMHEITETLYRKSQIIDPRYIRNGNYLRNQTKKLTDYIATSGRTVDEVEATFNFGFTDSFWCNVLTSVDTFLRNYAKIFRKMKDKDTSQKAKMNKYAGAFENSHIGRDDYEEAW